MALEAYLSELGNTIIWKDSKVKKDVVSTQLKWIKTALAKKKNSGSRIVLRPRTSKAIPPVAFTTVLGFLHANELPRQTWEPSPSFYTFAEIYFAAEYFGIQSLKESMIKCVEDLTRYVLSLSGRDGGPSSHCPHCPYYREEEDEVELEREQHLASFLDAVVCVEEHKWSAKIQKAVYDAGDRMKHRLVKLPAWREFIDKYPGGKGFARAIGMRL
ncbi:hypothetical protein C8A03DRAFT_31101 [Achaetomium macrosporum]|uniref:Uncharacterized protein n=1 Tax=Achaetomium macrosporum TaxID=79813 RepID=A0AAN7CF31_9PEZI|nr:hypothetical protein C8A03DRAFT_31101 [Achaetomium macrosporum]